ncbi:MAG: hypothetical protein DMG07_04540 [Acidobacteria bacterium]|nr:MAG: hypothetical protein DMG07_04540 [Acidobacteriota bacterium]
MSSAEYDRSIQESRLAQKPRNALRSVLVGVVYLVLFALLDLLVARYEALPGVNHWYLPAGLSLGLLLAFGLQYAALVFVAYLVANLMAPVPGSVLTALLDSACPTILFVLGSALLRGGFSGPPFRLEGRMAVLKFLLVGAIASVGSGYAVAVNLVMTGLLQWQEAVRAGLHGSLGTGTGILTLAPAVILYAAPLANLSRRRTTRRPARRADDALISLGPRLEALLLVGLLAGVGSAVFGLRLTHRFEIFALMSLPVAWTAQRRGLGVCGASVALAFALVVGLRLVQVGVGESTSLQVVLLGASLNGVLIGTVVADRRLGDETVRRRGSTLEAIDFAAEQLLGRRDKVHGVREVLNRLGAVMDVSRAYVLGNRFTPSGVAFEPLVDEWAASGFLTDPNDLKVLGVVRAQVVTLNTKTLRLGQALQYRGRDLPKKEQEILTAFDIRSTLIIPIFVDQQWWGCLGLDRSVEGRAWPETEISAVNTVAQILGALLAGVRVEEQFRQLTGNIQAVFWITSPDGSRMEYVSPAYAEIWGRSCESLYEEPRSWLESLYFEDDERVKAAVVRRGWGEYDEEYRVVRPDRTIRWIRDRAFPVRDQSGQVYSIVGIAEDITEQKKAEEQLRATTVLLYTLMDNLRYGILVEEESRRITHVNQALCSMFSVPAERQSLIGVDSRLLFVSPRSFGRRIDEIAAARKACVGEEVVHEDGRIMRRDYIPLSVGDEYRYHLWQYEDITASKKADEQIRASLEEKEVLLKEIHHRVKNNLQIISSLLSLQATQIQDVRALQTFKESQNRVKAMALVHERLYQSGDLARIDFADYVRNLTNYLLKSYEINPKVIRLKLDVHSETMNIDVAIPCGLIISELVSNALKYAFPDGRNGDIWVRFKPDGERDFRLVVGDDGVGMSKVGAEDLSSLGLKLVRSLTDQIGGTMTQRNEHGLEFDIRMPRVRS